MSLEITVIKGNIFETKAKVIVNPWNRNIIPRELLMLSGVSKELLKRAGTEPFKELKKMGAMPLGSARLTGSGNLKEEGIIAIIHVCGINLAWMSSEKAIRQCVQNAMSIVKVKNFSSIAFPLIGAGSLMMTKEKSKEIILEELSKIEINAKAYVVEYE